MFSFIHFLAEPCPLITKPFAGIKESAPLNDVSVSPTIIASVPNSFVPVLKPKVGL